jgi:colicin import membrane protein
LIRDTYNIVPFILAGLFHALVFGGLLFVFDFSRPARPLVPLAINATLVAESDMARPPAVVKEPAPEPAPEPEPPAIVEPEPEPEPEPDRAEEERARLEEEKRQADLRVEQDRIRKQEEADQKRRAEEEAERKRRQEDEVEKRRAEAERKRLEDLERQRLENERLKAEAEKAERQRQLDAELAVEAARLDALNSGELARYHYALQSQIMRNWIEPPSALPGIECVVQVQQLPNGEVIEVTIAACNGDQAVRRSIEAAVRKASPLPLPANRSLFDRNLTITFRPEE